MAFEKGVKPDNDPKHERNDEIKRRIYSGEKAIDLAKEYGISVSTIHYCVKSSERRQMRELDGSARR